MKITVIDGQGGRMGKSVIEQLKKAHPHQEIYAIGTNSIATSAMLKAGAHEAATGENSVAVACRRADVIVGPVGIVVADSMLGEITPAMALAVAQSPARRVLIPFNQCDNVIVGVQDYSVSALIRAAVAEISGK